MITQGYILEEEDARADGVGFKSTWYIQRKNPERCVFYNILRAWLLATDAASRGGTFWRKGLPQSTQKLLPPWWGLHRLNERNEDCVLCGDDQVSLIAELYLFDSRRRVRIGSMSVMKNGRNFIPAFSTTSESESGGGDHSFPFTEMTTYAVTCWLPPERTQSLIFLKIAMAVLLKCSCRLKHMLVLNHSG